MTENSLPATHSCDFEDSKNLVDCACAESSEHAHEDISVLCADVAESADSTNSVNSEDSTLPVDSENHDHFSASSDSEDSSHTGNLASIADSTNTIDSAQYCRDIFAKSKSSFNGFASWFLAPEKLRAICALYAFCRVVDDIVDESKNADTAHQNLKIWRTRIQSLENLKNDTHPICRELAWAVPHFSLNLHYFEDILKGVAMDLLPPDFPDFAALDDYCYYVAGAVGLLIAQILGYTDKNTEKYAHDLGVALQLVNILRDIKEDQDRHRLYIPKTLFESHQDFKEMCAEIANESERFFDSAEEIYKKLPALDQKSQKFGLFLGAIYYALLQKIKREHFPVLEKRMRVGYLTKLCAAGRVYLFNSLR